MFSTKNKRKQLEFRLVHIEADSHGRHMAGFLQDLVAAGTKVSSVVKPGAKLLSVLSRTPLPERSCSVIVAGANDLAAYEQGNIYRHLEEQVVTKLQHSKVVLTTLPTRHDLPTNHPINKQTDLVNKYIKKLAFKYDGVEVVNFNSIGRSFFTGHGMHLKLPGKRLLAGMIAESLCRVGVSLRSTEPAGHLTEPLPTVGHKCADDKPLPSVRTPLAAGPLSYARLSSAAGPLSAAGPSSSSVTGLLLTSSKTPPVIETLTSEPFILPYNSYAEALRQPPSPKESLPTTTEGLNSSKSFYLNL